MALISDLEADAKAEAQGIIQEAEKQVAEKRRYADKQIASIRADARKTVEEQGAAIEKRAISAAELEIKRRGMAARDGVMRDIMGRVEERLAALIDDSPRYRSVLVAWIAEAAVGLGAERAEVNASDTERALIDEAVLRDAAAQAQAQTNRPVTLTVSAAAPLKSQGVVLTAADGRTAFNNQVRTRLQRRQRQIRTLIYDALFTDNRKE